MLNEAPKTGTGDLLVSVQAVEPIRIPNVPIGLNELCSEVLAILCSEEQRDMEAKVNHFIFEIYDLSPKEIAYIEEKFS